MKFETKNIIVETEGAQILRISSPSDGKGMNWVIPEHGFGRLFGFTTEKTVESKGSSLTYLRSSATITTRAVPSLRAKIKRRTVGRKFVETYSFTNVSKNEFFLNQESFGINLPLNCLQKRDELAPGFLDKLCTAHVWCGDSVCYLYGAKFSGEKPQLVINMTKGNVSDYSIVRRADAVRVGADYRGDIVLNPTPCIISPGETKVYEFEYFFTDGDVKSALKKQANFILAESDVYTPSLGDAVNITLSYDGSEKVSVLLDEKELEVEKNGSAYSLRFTPSRLGEHVFDVYAGDRHTFLKIFVILPVPELTVRRAEFIAKYQQFIKEGSHLDGAYLIYDNVEKRMHYNLGWADHNAGRERIGMGILMARSLQISYGEERMQSLRRHLEFVLRELYDEDRAYVFNDAGRQLGWERYYNYPWFVLYFYEWYMLTKEKRFIVNSARCLLRYYKHVKNNELLAQCLEPVLVLDALNEAGENELYEKVKRASVRNLNKILACPIHDIKPGECTVVNEMLDDKVCYLAQATVLTGKKKYVRSALEYLPLAQNMSSFQPDYRLNSVPVRHWDRFWFGKRKEHGDVFPHYWSALEGVMYHWLARASGKDFSARKENCLRNNLCLFAPDGSASNNYLFPYKITLPAPDGYENEWLPSGEFYGKSYDEWSNDQDWALYFASRLL